MIKKNIKLAKIVIILPNLPNYSETFFQNQILGLEKLGYLVSLYVNTKSNSNANLLLPESISVYTQPNVKNKIKLFFILLYLLFVCPLRYYRFIKYDFKPGEASVDGVILPPSPQNPGVFELKNPNENVKGVVL